MTRLGIHREVEKVVGVGAALLVGLALTGLAQALVVKVASGTASHAREELALALAIILLGFLMMIVRRNARDQVVGFMSMENGLILAATGARGMPLVVEVSVAFSVLIALFVFARLRVPHPRALRYRRHRGARPHARGPPMIHAYQLVVAGARTRRRWSWWRSRLSCGAIINVLASAATLRAPACADGERGGIVGDYAIVDEFNVVFIVINTLVGFNDRAVQRLLHRPRDRDRPAVARLRVVLSRRCSRR